MGNNLTKFVFNLPVILTHMDFAEVRRSEYRDKN